MISIFIAFNILCLFEVYKTKLEGTIYLENAPGLVKITREKETGIAHIHGDNLFATMYG